MLVYAVMSTIINYEGTFYMDNVLGTLIVIAGICGWITHIIVAIAAQAWMFMIVGALLMPIAVIHGWSVWLGFNWLH